MVATTTAELRAHARAVRARLYAPANAVVDQGIDLRRPRWAGNKPPLVVIVEPPPVQAEKRPGHITIARVLKIVAEFYQQPVEAVQSPSRAAPLAKARHVTCYLARDLLHRSFPEIGRAVCRNHSTVIVNFQKFERQLPQDPRLAHEVDLLRRRILGGDRSER